MAEQMKKTVEVVIPCFNEEECVRLIYDAFLKIAKENDEYDWELLYVDDGSKDATLDHIKELTDQNGIISVHYVSFARNFGKEAGIYAGLKNSQGNFVVLIDADLQHPPELVPHMLQIIQSKKVECCGARRKNRTGEGKIRSLCAEAFYHMLSWMTGVKMEQGTTDFRVMTRKFVDAVLSLSEQNRFTKGIFSWVGFETAWVEYDNVQRAAGETKWTFGRLVRYAVNGFLAFAVSPLRGAVYVGFAVMIAAFLYLVILLADAVMHGATGSGYASIMALILFTSGIIIMLLGVIGEYLARIYIEVKERPIYIEKESSCMKENR